MSSTLRAAICSALVCCFSGILLAQNPAVVDQSSPVITAAVAGETVRFTAPAGSVQMRVQVRFAGGDPLFDSAWRDGNILDWIADTPGQPLANGSYRCVVMTRDLEGRVTTKDAAIVAEGGRLSIEPLAAGGGLTLARPGESGPKITALAHDGTNGAVVSASGDLSFRFGNFLAATDIERMRLTREGNLGIGTDTPKALLDVNGFIRTSKGILFEDGTILTSSGFTTAERDRVAESGSIVRRSPGGPGSSNIGVVPSPPILPLAPVASSAGHRPRPNFAPAYQFTVGDTGVAVGTTNPNYKLDVTGMVNTATGYSIGGQQFATALNGNAGNTVVGRAAGNPGLTGNVNSFFGVQAGQLDTTGSNNSFFGYQSGASNIDGNDNAFFGLFTGVFATGNFGTFVGSRAGFHTSSGWGNTALGFNALHANTVGGYNTAVGYNALQADNNGYNIALGVDAGNSVTGTFNIDIGNRGVAGESNTIRIGDNTYVSRTFIAGVNGVTTGMAATPVLVDSLGQLGTSSSSRRYKFEISDMDHTTDDLMRLRPVTFRYLTHGPNAPLQYGLIAEEVAEVYPELVVRNRDGEVDTVMYQFLAPMLLNHVQKLNRTIDDQQKTIDALNDKLAALGERLEALEARASRD